MFLLPNTGSGATAAVIIEILATEGEAFGQFNLDLVPGETRQASSRLEFEMTDHVVQGHCAGQLAFHWSEQGGVLFAADAASNAFGLSLSPVHEDLDEGKRSLSKLASLEFEVACFGHGKPITSAAGERFRKQWSPVRETTAQG